MAVSFRRGHGDRDEALLRQIHLLEECLVARILFEILEERITLEDIQIFISCFVGTIQPLEGVIFLAAESVDSRDLGRPGRPVMANSFAQFRIGLFLASPGEVSHRGAL